MTTHGAIRVVAHVLEMSCSEEPGTTAAAYTVLSSLLCRDAGCADGAAGCHCGYWRLICAALREFPDAVDVQRAACEALRRVVPPEALLYKDEHNDEPAVALVVAAMARYPTDAAVQASGCAVLKRCINEARGVSAVSELGGVLAALHAVANNVADARVQCRALGVLGCHSTCSLFNDREAEVLLPLALRAMAAHPRAHGVQREGCTFLANLCFTLVPGCSARGHAEGCLSAALQALETHGKTVKVARYACIALHNLLRADAVEPDSAALVLERVVSAMVLHSSDATILIMACKSIALLCDILDVWSDACWLACAVVHAARTCHRDDSKVQRNTLAALRSLADLSQRQCKETDFVRWAFQVQA